MKYFLYLISFIILILFACNEAPIEIKINGFTQGTTYNITYTSHITGLQNQIDSVLNEVDLSMSTYKNSSIITAFNKSDSGIYIDSHFLDVYNKSKEIYKLTNGYFDPTVGPLINFWEDKKINDSRIDSIIIDSLLNFVGFDKISLKSDSFLYKTSPHVNLNFNAIAQGYSVDLLTHFLESKGIKNYMVEIGGELKVKGKNANGNNWKIGIDKPLENNSARELTSVIELTDKAMATSGNYRKHYMKNGKKYTHTLNPNTGYTAENNLLSTTVITENCIDADAYATAFMAMGFEKTIQFLSTSNHLTIYLIYTDEDGNIKEFVSDELKNKIKKL